MNSMEEKTPSPALMLTREGVEPCRSDYVSMELIIKCFTSSSPPELTATLADLGRG